MKASSKALDWAASLVPEMTEATIEASPFLPAALGPASRRVTGHIADPARYANVTPAASFSQGTAGLFMIGRPGLRPTIRREQCAPAER